MKTLIIAPCGSRKAAAPAPARSFYTGVYARLALEHAEQLAGSLEDAGVLILSAKYGLVGLDDVLEPYNATFGRAHRSRELVRAETGPGTVTLEQLRAQLERRELAQLSDVRVVAGSRYVAIARELWPAAAAVIPAGLGIGEQLHWLKVRSSRYAPVGELLAETLVNRDFYGRRRERGQ